MDNTQSALPAQFATLAEYLKLALPTTKERLRARANSTMPELQAFYDGMTPHMDGILAYLQDFPPEEKKLEPQVLRLVHLAKAFMEVSVSIELLHAPDEPMVVSFEDMRIESF